MKVFKVIKPTLRTLFDFSYFKHPDSILYGGFFTLSLLIPRILFNLP